MRWRPCSPGFPARTASPAAGRDEASVPPVSEEPQEHQGEVDEVEVERWKEAWASFYDDRNRGDDYTLIKVTPSRLEIVSLAHNIINDPVTWRPVIVDLRK